jgi:hypothetical protein
VIVWLNGPFGVGKTSVAVSVRASVPGSIIFDPEIIGNLLHLVVPVFRSRDYQDLPSWRWLTREGASLSRRFGRVVIVPMTVTNERYFAEIVERLRGRTDLRHFTLMAPREEILRRLAGRTDPTWETGRLDASLATLSAARFDEHIETSGRSAAEVAAIIRSRVTSLANTPER